MKLIRINQLFNAHISCCFDNLINLVLVLYDVIEDLKLGTCAALATLSRYADVQMKKISGLVTAGTQ